MASKRSFLRFAVVRCAALNRSNRLEAPRSDAGCLIVVVDGRWWQEGHKVALNVYDLSNGRARQPSTASLGKPIEAIWHTGVVVYGSEYFFGGGIRRRRRGRRSTAARAGRLRGRHPPPREVFEDYLRDIAPRYTAATYSLLTHNCNNFTNEVAQFLVGAGIPDYILNLPNEVLSGPMGAMIMPMIQNLEATLRNNAAPQTTQFVPTPASVSVPKPAAATAASKALRVLQLLLLLVRRRRAALLPSKKERRRSKQTRESRRGSFRLWLTLSEARGGRCRKR
ncbi:hypothetical protein ZWY2020_023504 [Hordeum vulgare]|nr:hypothetical protein ZWY2020_023504 [Hordeum vulgare]